MHRFNLYAVAGSMTRQSVWSSLKELSLTETRILWAPLKQSSSGIHTASLNQSSFKSQGVVSDTVYAGITVIFSPIRNKTFSWGLQCVSQCIIDTNSELIKSSKTNIVKTNREGYNMQSAAISTNMNHHELRLRKREEQYKANSLRRKSISKKRFGMSPIQYNKKQWNISQTSLHQSIPTHRHKTRVRLLTLLL